VRERILYLSIPFLNPTFYRHITKAKLFFKVYYFQNKCTALKLQLSSYTVDHSVHATQARCRCTTVKLWMPVLDFSSVGQSNAVVYVEYSVYFLYSQTL
jgi:hypothetical protein